MANGKYNRLYTAADIEKYHAGKLSPAERNAIEKAALDDPFLADAIEGYAYAKNPSADLADLRHRLDSRLKGGKIISFPTWLRAAAMVIIIAGAGLLVYQFAFNNKDSEKVAMQDKTVETRAPVPVNTDSITTDVTVEGPVKNQPGTKAGTETPKEPPVTLSMEDARLGATAKDTHALATGKKDMAADTEAEIKKETDKVTLTKDQPAALNAKASVEGYAYRAKNNALKETKENYFRGRVVDANNKPVPFASIINTRDNAGTYSDARGDFNLLSPDSVLNVQVRSIGYENNNAQLRNDITTNKVIMQSDTRGMDEVVISRKRLNSERTRNNNKKLEEPTPADGWENYDTYIVNNLKVPEELRDKETSGEVEVSFEVDKNGEPVNIKVEKSLCSVCDQEAIRLVKEGPKWNRTSRKGRTSVRVAF